MGRGIVHCRKGANNCLADHRIKVSCYQVLDDKVGIWKVIDDFDTVCNVHVVEHRQSIQAIGR